MTEKEYCDQLSKDLNRYTELYDAGHPSISDKEWDDLYFKLVALEEKSGYISPFSPTHKVVYSFVSDLEIVHHDHPMLSLDKTKDLDDIRSFLNDKDYLCMGKMDGLTCSLRYEHGKLVKAETRGDGEKGENVLHNALVIPSIPKRISYRDTLIVDGEIISTYKNFSDFDQDYKNPRNFAAGSIRLLDSRECAQRHLTFVAWDVIQGFNEVKLLSDKLNKLSDMNFVVVPYILNKIDENYMIDVAKNLSYPIDGLVFKFNDIQYGKEQGSTEHHFKNALAYKFYDEAYPTNLIDIEYSLGRTGQITPVAIFEPITIDGTTISRASLHNLSVMSETLKGNAGIGQKIYVAKMNCIIPQIVMAESSQGLPIIPIPKVCPICGHELEIRNENGISTLWCTNENCECQFINRLDHFCGKKGLDIKGLSKATLTKLMEWGWINSYSDIFTLDEHKIEWENKKGFGERSVERVLDAIQSSRNCPLDKFITAIGIPLIGSRAAKELSSNFSSWSEFYQAVQSKYPFWSLPNFGAEMSDSIMNFDYTEMNFIYNNYIQVPEEKPDENHVHNLYGLNFVITGSLTHFKNRAELQSQIEARGGKVRDGISKNTSILINNDITSTSAKNKKAHDLNIPIMSEDQFIKEFFFDKK